MKVWSSLCFFFNDTATTEIYTLSLHDALPIWIHTWVRSDDVLYDIGANVGAYSLVAAKKRGGGARVFAFDPSYANIERSEEHTSELQSRQYLVCRLLLEKKNLNSRALSVGNLF